MMQPSGKILWMPRSLCPRWMPRHRWKAEQWQVAGTPQRYICCNPVKHGHATCPHPWPRKSFHRLVAERSTLPTGVASAGARFDVNLRRSGRSHDGRENGRHGPNRPRHTDGQRRVF